MTEETTNPTPEQEQPQEMVEDYGVKNTGVMGLFPTPLFISDLSDITMCDRLEKRIKELRKKQQGTFEAGNFTTYDDLQQVEGFEEFSQLVLKHTDVALDFFKVVREAHYITNMWANITNPNHRHPVHPHPNALLSGILYIRTPEKCGPLVFPDPRPAARVFEPSYAELNEWNAGRFTFPVKKGVMLLWPSWAHHGVERGFGDEKDERIAIAFNIHMLGKITTRTATLELN